MNTQTDVDIRDIAFDFAPKYEATIIPVEGKMPTKDKDGYREWWYKAFDTQLEDLPWQGATGFGILCGYGDYRCLDFDYVHPEKFPAVLTDLLNLLGLPADYRWTVKTGSGYHLWFRVPDPAENPPSDVTRFQPSSQYKESFHLFEWRHQDCYAVAPPSQYVGGGEYTFIHGIPDKGPPTLDYGTFAKGVFTIGDFYVEVCGRCYNDLPECSCEEYDEFYDDRNGYY